jgi:hypothetical protein
MMCSVAVIVCNAMNGLVMMPSKACTVTGEAMRKEDEAREEFEATAHESKMDEDTTLMIRALQDVDVLNT